MLLNPNELNFSDKKISMIIAGVPGIGKTTLALSSPKPLLIDLDKGISRVDVKHRAPILTANNYEEIVSDLKSIPLDRFETIVIDTGGKLLEMLKPVVIKDDPKNGKRDGNLSLQGYGAIKKKFAEFVNFVRGLNKNLIIVFHATEVNLSDDITGLRIRIEGSSRDDVWDDIDIGGFVEMKGKQRTIGFSNCDRYYAKGTQGVSGIYEIPMLEGDKQNDFVTKLFDTIKNKLNEETSAFAEYQQLVSEHKDKINKINDVSGLNSELDELKSVNHVMTSKAVIWAALTAKADELGAKYDGNEAKFV